MSELERKLRFVVSGVIGTVLFYLLYEGLMRVIWWDLYRPTLSWLVSYFVSIAWQMELHARLGDIRWRIDSRSKRIVFQQKIVNYVETLVKIYAAYGISIVASTAINWLLIEFFTVEHRISWIMYII